MTYYQFPNGETYETDYPMSGAVKLTQKAGKLAVRERSSDRIVACDANYEDGEMTCAHTGQSIPSAYAE